MNACRLEPRTAKVPLTLVRAPILQRLCRCGNHSAPGGECESCRRSRATERDGGGLAQPLDPVTREVVESRFGHDFSQVRVHADGASSHAAATLNARAFTVGQHIHFGAGEYDPRSQPGMRLLAHELAHTVQQSGVSLAAAQAFSEASEIEDDRLEHEAGRAAEQVLAGLPAHTTSGSAPVSPQRDDKKKAPPVPRRIVAPVAPGKTQSLMIQNARRAAAIRTQTAMFKARGLRDAGEYLEAKRLAQIKFDWADPNMDQVGQVLGSMGGGLVTVDVKVAGAGDPECSYSGYVRGHRPPIILCPRFFADPADNEGRIRTMVHEMAHVVGIGKADATERYYPIFDCTSTGAFESADAWSNYVHCLSGQTPDTPPQVTGGKPGKPKKP